RVELAPEVGDVARPIGETVERAAIAQRRRYRVLFLDHALLLDLHAIDGPLRRAPPALRAVTWKATAEHHPRGRRQHGDTLTATAPHHLEQRSFACARCAGHDDETALAGHRYALLA